jgi:hypothetical protein
MTLDKTYEDMLCRIEGDEDRMFARDILELLSYAMRGLNLARICEYLQITPGMSVLDESKRLMNPKDVRFTLAVAPSLT